MYYSFVLIAYKSQFVSTCRIFLCLKLSLHKEIVIILSDHMQPKPSFTLFCELIYGLEMIQLIQKKAAYMWSCNNEVIGHSK